MPHDVLNLLCVEGDATREEVEEFFRSIAPQPYVDSFKPSPSRRVESPLIDFRRIVSLPPPPRLTSLRSWLRSWIVPYDQKAVQTNVWGTKWPAYALWFPPEEEEEEEIENESEVAAADPKRGRPNPAAWIMRPGVRYLTRGFVRYKGEDEAKAREIEFFTAWSAPDPVMRALSKQHPHLHLALYSYTEYFDYFRCQRYFAGACVEERESDDYRSSVAERVCARISAATLAELRELRCYPSQKEALPHLLHMQKLRAGSPSPSANGSPAPPSPRSMRMSLSRPSTPVGSRPSSPRGSRPSSPRASRPASPRGSRPPSPVPVRMTATAAVSGNAAVAPAAAAANSLSPPSPRPMTRTVVSKAGASAAGGGSFVSPVGVRPRRASSPSGGPAPRLIIDTAPSVDMSVPVPTSASASAASPPPARSSPRSSPRSPPSQAFEAKQRAMLLMEQRGRMACWKRRATAVQLPPLQAQDSGAAKPQIPAA